MDLSRFTKYQFWRLPCHLCIEIVQKFGCTVCIIVLKSAFIFFFNYHTCYWFFFFNYFLWSYCDCWGLYLYIYKKGRGLDVNYFILVTFFFFWLSRAVGLDFLVFATCLFFIAVHSVPLVILQNPHFFLLIFL